MNRDIKITINIHTKKETKKDKKIVHSLLFRVRLYVFFETAGADINTHLKVRSGHRVRFRELLLIVALHFERYLACLNNCFRMSIPVGYQQ